MERTEARQGRVKHRKMRAKNHPQGQNDDKKEEKRIKKTKK